MSNPQSSDFIRAIKPVAREILGEPDEIHGDEWRYGGRGSLCVDTGKATWFDHEANEGGGLLDLLRVHGGMLNGSALDWLRERGHLPPKPAEKRIVATYDYTNANRTLLFQVVRYDPKDFRQRRPDGSGGWVWKMAGVERVPYRLPEVTAAVRDGRRVHVVEGEKAADALAALGVTATCSPGGANKWRREYAAFLDGADVVILPDNDGPGRSHALMVAESLAGLHGRARRIRVLALPGLPEKGDAADWIAAGGTAEALAALADKTPDFDPRAKVWPGPDVDPDSKPREAKPDPGEGTERTSGRPLVRLLAGELHTAATEGEAAIIAAGKSIYQRGDALVRPIVREVAASRGRMTKAAGLGEQSAYAMLDLFSQTAEWERFDGRAGDWVRANPPMAVAHILLARQGAWNFPSIAGVVTCPTLRPDGSILTAPGYDPATKLFHVIDETVALVPEVHQPTRKWALEALAAFNTLIDEFPFVGEEGDNKNSVSRAVALSGLITPVVRGALAVAPLHGFRATTAGSGKTHLVDTASAIVTGRPCPVISAAPDEAETEKRIAGLLLAGYPLISIDNVNGELGGDLLCQAIERPLIRLRRLGGSDITEIENACTIYATGNQMRVRGDMVRRSLIGDLDAQVERPELRRFKGDPVATVLANRGRYVSAALMIVRAYLAVGKPDRLDPVASFGDWSDLVRSALVWLGCADPAQSMETARADDPELAELREMLTVWRESLGTAEGFTTAEVARRANEHIPPDPNAIFSKSAPPAFKHPELRDALLRAFGERGSINTKRLGKWLTNREGRILDSHRFRRTGTAMGGLIRWGMEPTSKK